MSVCVSAVALSDTGCQMLRGWHRKAISHEDSELAEWSLLLLSLALLLLTSDLKYIHKVYELSFSKMGE